MKQVMLFKDNRYIEITEDSDVRLNAQLLPDQNGTIFVTNSDEKVFIHETELVPFQKVHIDEELSALLFVEDEVLFSKSFINGSILIGNTSNADIWIDDTKASLLLTDVALQIVEGSAYVNGKERFAGSYSVSAGDCIMVGATKIILKDQSIVCSGSGYTCHLKRAWKDDEINEDFPIYKRSPRMIKPLPSSSVSVELPEKLTKSNKQLVKIIVPPLVTLCITIALGIFMGRGIMMLIGAATTAMTLIFSIVTFVTERKEKKIQKEKRERTFDHYLVAKRAEIYSLYQQQIDSLLYHNPSVENIETMITHHSSRIYERSATDSDFLCLALGLASQPLSFQIKKPNRKIDESEDELEKELYGVLDHYTVVPDMPVVIDLKQAHLGLVGEPKYIKKVLVSIITQLCFHQSYHDIELIALIHPKDETFFEWMKWYPHCKAKSINISGLVSSENQRDQVLGNIAQILKERKQKQDEAKQDSLYLPHYVFIIDNPKMIINHSIMEYLQLQSMNLGFSLIYTTNIQANLPDNVHTIFNVNENHTGILVMDNSLLLNKKVTLYNIENIELERMSRTITPLIHHKGVSTQIPDSITFFELYGVKKPKEIPLEQLWNNNKCYKSLAVPLGVRAKDDIVYLNLHEKAHGPHGLVAGTTGSGKSEIVQSYILSLAINFHPYDVGFLLIDYKGGGMANLFERLPHLLGTITNLDGSESMRALASIKSELLRRQKIFGEHEVNNINQYTKLFKAGKATEPMPHLFLISDEFAELKKEQPDFMSELVSAARIGRSLGVHLILATQKPSGVVDDQIWSNSKFKLALKVQNESDSNEVIKTPDAARITQPGRAYLQVGNNEVYELFQSAWSGAEYSDTVVEKGYDNRIYKVNQLGQGELLNDDLSEGETEHGVVATQLDVVVDYIKETYEKQGCKNVEKPWLPPLEHRMVSPYINVGQDVGKCEGYDLQITVGMVDIPENQKQEEYQHDFFKDGNFAIFGSSGFGKSTGEMNIALELACKNSPVNLNYYILDFGTSSLIQLKELPHTADYITFDEEEKIDKFIKLTTQEIKKRKSLFAAQNAMNFKMYNNNSANKIPAILVLIDNYDVVREIGMEFEAFITKLTRDGVGVGIYTVIDASRSSAVKYSVLSNFKNKITHYMFDPSDAISVVGRSKYSLPEVKGRALVKLNEVCVMQCYLPVLYENDDQYADAISKVVKTIARENTAAGPKGIPMLPEFVTYQDIYDESLLNDKKLPIGLDTEDVMVQALDLSVPTHVIVGPPQSGKTNIIKIACQAFHNNKIFISDTRAMELSQLSGNEMVTYMNTEDQLDTFLCHLEEEVQKREQEYEMNRGTITLKEFCERQPAVLILIDDGDYFVEITKSQAKRAEEVLKKAIEYGVTIITATVPGKLRGFDNTTKLLKDTQSGVVLGNPAEQTMFMLPPIRGYKPQVEKGFLCHRGQTIAVQIPIMYQGDSL